MPSVTVTQHFDAPPAAVYDAWIDRERMRLFMMPTDRIVAIDAPAKIGGRMRIVVERQGEQIEHSGSYKELARPVRLAFTWGVPRYSPNETLVTIDLTPARGGTDLTLTQSGLPDDDEIVRKNRDGWQTICARLAGAIKVPSASR
jgi:uncharacterized protein YndB with AHSA1/START domain